ncbi:MAG: hypothetical protein ABEK50_13885, partial [bacterium]
STADLPQSVGDLHASLRNRVDFVERDRPLKDDIETVVSGIRNRELPVVESVQFIQDDSR